MRAAAHEYVSGNAWVFSCVRRDAGHDLLSFLFNFLDECLLLFCIDGLVVRHIELLEWEAAPLTGPTTSSDGAVEPTSHSDGDRKCRLRAKWCVSEVAFIPCCVLPMLWSTCTVRVLGTFRAVSASAFRWRSILKERKSKPSPTATCKSSRQGPPFLVQQKAESLQWRTGPLWRLAQGRRPVPVRGLIVPA